MERTYKDYNYVISFDTGIFMKNRGYPFDVTLNLFPYNNRLPLVNVRQE